MKRFLVLFGVVLVALIGNGVARAHSDLVSSTPEDGRVLDAPPPGLTFTFNEDLMPDFVNFIATDEAGDVTELIVTGVIGPTATVAWPADAPGGEWIVDYRVVSQDGHPVEGGIAFTYAAASPTPTSSSSTPIPTTSSPQPESSASSPEPPPQQPSPSAVPASESSGPDTGWIIAIVAVGVLIVVAAVGILARRRAS